MVTAVPGCRVNPITEDDTYVPPANSGQWAAPEADGVFPAPDAAGIDPAPQATSTAVARVINAPVNANRLLMVQGRYAGRVRLHATRGCQNPAVGHSDGMSSPKTRPVTIIGAGITGVACAVGLRTAGVPFRLVERGRAVGGRMASPTVQDRRVDIGAGYFTVRDTGFSDVVREWADAGLAREWTDTFGVLRVGAEPETTTGPMRWATPGGLRSLVRALLDDIPVELGTELTELPSGPVVLAMPDPQAARLVPVPAPVEYEPVLAAVLQFEARTWPFVNAAFVNDHPTIGFVADDGARRGDGAPVLVAHSTALFAGEHLDHPDGAVEPMSAAVRELLGLPEPERAHVHRWTFAKPSGQHDATFALVEDGGRLIGFAGDQWCPSGAPRVESAWRSGTDLAAAITAAQ